MTAPDEVRAILPGATIGVLGGGQLGRMMALAGRAMGYRFVCLDPTPDGPCGQVCDHQQVAALDDVEAARALAARADVVTYEFENVAPAMLDAFARDGYAPQGAELLTRTRNRLREKEAVRAAGAAVAPYAPVQDGASLDEALAQVGRPAVLKTVTGGYDGKGQRVIQPGEDAHTAFQELAGAGAWVVERRIDFAKELSVVVARNAVGEVRSFPVAENVHEANVLRLSLAPARVPAEVAERAAAIGRRLADALDLVGVMGVEMFWTEEGELLVNELAPRPHNSGHYTLDACLTSQFEQHVRAICGLPLGATRQHTPAVMANLLGDELEAWRERMRDAAPEGITVKTHLYGKAEARPGRKMGHVTVLATSVEAALGWIRTAGIWSR